MKLYKYLKAVNIFSAVLSFMALLGLTCMAKSQSLPMNKVKDLLNRKVFTFDGKTVKLPSGITTGRYMEKDVTGGCKSAVLPNWVGFPLKECTYSQPDKSAPQKVKMATVIMLNPEKEILAKWIIASCLIVNGNNDLDGCANRLAFKIVDASGSQFAVAGIVLEDQRPQPITDGVQEAYTFRDGVTVKLENGLPVGFTGIFGDPESKLALDPHSTVIATASENGPARIQSTSRQMYQDYAGANAKDVTGIKWLDVVRELYQDAWRRAHTNKPETIEKYCNDLMIAKLKSLKVQSQKIVTSNE